LYMKMLNNRQISINFGTLMHWDVQSVVAVSKHFWDPPGTGGAILHFPGHFLHFLQVAVTFLFVKIF
jgi:hypothetical protein